MIKPQQLKRAGGPERLARYLKQRQPKPTDEHGGHDGPNVSIRTSTHNGYEIEIRTSYEIKIGGEPLEGHMGVGSDGRVHYHPIPNYSAASMVELVESVVDAFPDDYPPIAKHGKGRTKRPSSKSKKADTHHGRH